MRAAALLLFPADVSTTSLSFGAVTLSTADFLLVATSALDTVAVLATADLDAGAASVVSSARLLSSCTSFFSAVVGRTSCMLFCDFGLLRDAPARALAVFFGIVSLSLAHLPRQIRRVSRANYG